MQPTPHTSVWVSYPDATLYHLTVAVETNRTGEDGREDPEDRRPGDVNVTYDAAIQVLADANATGAFDPGYYERASRDRGHARIDLWHAETVTLGEERFRDLRETVTRAGLGDRADRYTGPHRVSDGCGIDLAAWTVGGYAHVYRTTMNGPDEVKALDALHLDLHPEP